MFISIFIEYHIDKIHIAVMDMDESAKNRRITEMEVLSYSTGCQGIIYLTIWPIFSGLEYSIIYIKSGTPGLRAMPFMP